MRLLLFLAFLVFPALEIWLLVLAGQLIGGWPTLGLLIAGALLGSWLIRREGRRAWRGLQEALNTGRLPEREPAGSGLILAGGALLIVPGFLSDLLALLFLLPFARPLARRLGERFLAGRMRAMATAAPYGRPESGYAHPGFQPEDERPGPGVKVVHGEVVEESR